MVISIYGCISVWFGVYVCVCMCVTQSYFAVQILWIKSHVCVSWLLFFYLSILLRCSIDMTLILMWEAETKIHWNDGPFLPHKSIKKVGKLKRSIHFASESMLNPYIHTCVHIWKIPFSLKHKLIIIAYHSSLAFGLNAVHIKMLNVFGCWQSSRSDFYITFVVGINSRFCGRRIDVDVAYLLNNARNSNTSLPVLTMLRISVDVGFFSTFKITK